MGPSQPHSSTTSPLPQALPRGPRTGKARHSSLTQLPAAPGAGGRLSFVTLTGASPREAPCPGRPPLPLSVLGSPSARRLSLPQPGDAPLSGAEGCRRSPPARPVAGAVLALPLSQAGPTGTWGAGVFPDDPF